MSAAELGQLQAKQEATTTVYAAPAAPVYNTQAQPVIYSKPTPSSPLLPSKNPSITS